MSSAKPASRSSKRDKDESDNPDLHLNAIGNYNLIKTLGEGNFAKVKLATHKLTGAEVAIKVIDKTQLDDKKLAKLYREVRIMKSLHHPNIIKLYEVIETKHTVFLVMEMAGGGELYDYLVVHGKMKEREARAKFRQILSAVSYCHKKKIIHRDLKAENLLLDANLNIKIADFGFSNMFDPESKLDTFCGSPPYAAPELFQGRRYVGPEVDVWSLGVILYVLTTGCLPFDGKNLQEMRESVCRGKYRIPFYLSDGCEKLLRKFLVRDPLRRSSLDIVIDDVWVNENYGDSPITTDLSEKVDEDETIIKLMETKYQVPRDDIMKSLRDDLYNDIGATYYLMYHEKDVRSQIQAEVDRGEVLVSPFGSINSPVNSPSSSSSRKGNRSANASGSGTLVKSGMGRIEEDGSHGSPDGSKTPKTPSTKSKTTTRRRRITVSGEDRPDVETPVASPQIGSKKDLKEKETKKKSAAESQAAKDSNEIGKTDSSPNSPGGGRVERKRNNTIVGILRDRIRRPSELISALSPSSDKGNMDLIKSGTIAGSGNVDSQGSKGSITIIKPGEENKPRALRFTFNSNTTSTKNPDDIVQEVLRGCSKLAVTPKLLSKYLIECFWNNPVNGNGAVKLEIEVCKLPRLNNLHGLRFKRLGGSSSDYKEICEKLLQTILL